MQKERGPGNPALEAGRMMVDAQQAASSTSGNSGRNGIQTEDAFERQIGVMLAMLKQVALVASLARLAAGPRTAGGPQQDLAQ